MPSLSKKKFYCESTLTISYSKLAQRAKKIISGKAKKQIKQLRKLIPTNSHLSSISFFSFIFVYIRLTTKNLHALRASFFLHELVVKAKQLTMHRTGKRKFFAPNENFSVHHSPVGRGVRSVRPHPPPRALKVCLLCKKYQNK